MSVAATGFFDGMHLGHQKVILTVKQIAEEKGLRSQVVTFWPHPRSVLQQEAYNLRLLTSLEEKKTLIKSLGIDEVTVLEFSREFSMLTTEEFIREYLIGQCGVKILVIGYDHHIGHDQGKSQEDMMDICRRCGMEVVRVDEFTLDGKVPSSTKIRHMLEKGDVAGASAFLGRDYALKGVVVSGNHLGRTIGFPTANLKLYDPLKLVPGNGVYAVKVTLGRRNFKGICNIGVRPTVSHGTHISIETHILDFNEDIYGLDLGLEFAGRIRDEIKFDSLSDLKVQLEKDKESCLKYFL